MEDGRTGFKPSEITAEEHAAIGAKLNDPHNGLQGYMELKHWYVSTYSKEIKYNTLLKYCVRHFKSSCKVARKSHIKKDAGQVEHFTCTPYTCAAHSASKVRVKKLRFNLRRDYRREERPF